MAYDPKSLTVEQSAALLSFVVPLAAALKAGVPPTAIEAHVKGILARPDLHVALSKLGLR